MFCQFLLTVAKLFKLSEFVSSLPNRNGNISHSAGQFENEKRQYLRSATHKLLGQCVLKNGRHVHYFRVESKSWNTVNNKW